MLQPGKSGADRTGAWAAVLAVLAFALPAHAQPASLSAEFEALRAELVAEAIDVMARHDVLIAIRGDILDIEAEIEERRRHLGDGAETTSALTVSLASLARMPPAAFLAHPEGAAASVRAGIALNAILPGLTDRTRRLTGEIEALRQLRQALDSRRSDADEAAEALERAIIQVGELTRSREALEVALPGRSAAEQAALEGELRDLAARARDLRELVAGVAALDSGPPELGPDLPRPPVPDARDGVPDGIRLPASGPLRVSFGGAGRFGPSSPGIEIEAYPAAPVISPLGGEVRFADAFRGYGRMVIIEHPGDVYSLIAGLGRIDVAVGDSVAEGEPIGRVATPQNGHTVSSTLYFELRADGRPVDPIARLAELRQ